MSNLKLEIGKRYKDRAGFIVTILGPATSNKDIYAFEAQWSDGYTINIAADGKFCSYLPDASHDLIEEVVNAD